MKHLPLIIVTLIAATLFACNGDGSTEYDGELCRELSIKIESRDSLTSSDYSEMIAQDEAILRYLVARTKELSELPDSSRCNAWRNLTASPEYLERFGYMFTLGSALYTADRNGTLDSRNANRFKALDKYNEELAAYSDRY